MIDSRSRRLVVVVLGMVFGCVAACGSDDSGKTPSSNQDVDGTITVFAAASLTGAFESIGEAFETAHPDVDVVFSFGASSELVAQITEGAPADVFASADISNMTKLTEAAANAGTPTVFAHNSSAIIVAPGNPLGVAGIGDLANPDLILVTCAPEVPCGAYADQIFENAGVSVTPDSYEENVKAVVNKVVLGEADAGIAYATDVIAARDDAARDDAAGVEIPADINVVAEYPIVVTAEAPNPVAAAAFVTFVLGEEGQQILNGLGFTSP